MPCLVNGNRASLLIGDDLGTFLQAADDAVNGIHEILALHSLLLVASSDEGCLVADVGDIGTREAWGLPREQVEVHRAVGLDVAKVHLEYFLAVAELRQLDVDLAVKSSCTQQRLVEDVGTVGRSKDDDTTVGAEAVHLGEQLVEGALALVIAAQVCLIATGAAHGINLVDKDDAGGFLLGLPEEISHARSADADKHLNKVGTRHREEGHIGLARDSLSQQGLSGSRWAHKECALGYLATQLGVMLRVLEEVHDFGNLDFSLGESCNILEGDLIVIVLVKEASLGLANAEDASTASTGTAHSTEQEEPQSDQQDDGSESVKYHRQVITALDILHLTSEHALLAPRLDIVLELVRAGNLCGNFVDSHRGGSHTKGARVLGRQRLELLARERVFQDGLGPVLSPIDSDGLGPALSDDVLKLGPIHLLC